MAGLKLNHVYKRFDGGVTAVSDFTVDIEDKEFVVMVGPSGCGKTTTLRMIAGLEEISDGEVWIGDRLVNDVPPKDRDIAMVFQNYALYPHMTVYENMAFGLKLKKTPKDEIKRRVAEAAKILDIEHLLDRKPKALSGGQRQRVALGRAIVREPLVFLMDEPLSNLDAKLRVQMRTEIGKLHKRLQSTFIYVTHDQVEAMTMGTRIIVMKDGFIQQIDAPTELYNNPNNMFVAGFIGSPQMNFFDVKIEEEAGELYFAGNGFKVKVPADKAAKAKDLGYVGKEVVLGIRPEDIEDNAEALVKHADGVVDTHVDLVELMGAETYLYLSIAGKDFVARVDPRSTAKHNDDIKVAFDMSRCHVFDKETEMVILRD